MEVPLLDTTRARERLGGTPAHDAGAALLELVDAMAHRVEGPRR